MKFEVNDSEHNSFDIRSVNIGKKRAIETKQGGYITAHITYSSHWHKHLFPYSLRTIRDI